MNCGPRSVLQESGLSDQRGHVEDVHKRGQKDDKETESEETEEHRGGHLGSRVEVLVEERAATVVVVERETGVKDGDHAEDERDEPSYKQGWDGRKDGRLAPKFLHENESAILHNKIWTSSKRELA